MKMHEYWDLETRLSKAALYKVLYAVTILRGAITDTLTIGDLTRYEPKQNCHNTGYFRIKLPTGKREDFERLSGFSLRPPPKVQIS